MLDQVYAQLHNHLTTLSDLKQQTLYKYYLVELQKNRGRFDVVTSRAFTELKGFVEVALPYLSPNGRIIAIKGPSVVDEITPIKNFPGITGIETHEVKIPFSKRATTIVVIKKAD